MKNHTVYVLHKQGARSHYRALETLVARHSGKVVYHEFSVLTKILKAIRHRDWKLLKRQKKNISFMTSLLLTRNKKVVLGIAPFDSKLRGLLRLLKNHQIFYHTSWACWDKSFHPKTKANSPAVFEVWRSFLEDKTQAIFAVTQKTKEELVKNYDLPAEKISVVYHALAPAFHKYPSEPRRKNSFIYAGRLVAQKGLEEALDFFSKNPEVHFTIIGDGPLKALASSYSMKFSNITYLEHLDDLEALRGAFAQHQFLLLNSKRTPTKEELFGMVIIEAMSQGTVPVCTANSGPSEILSDHMGFLYPEGALAETLEKLLRKQDKLENMSQACMLHAQAYLPETLASRWKPVLSHD